MTYRQGVARASKTGGVEVADESGQAEPRGSPDPRLDYEIAFLEGVVARKGDYFDALNALAYDYTARGLHEKGLEADRRLAQLRPDDPGVLYNLACSLALTRQLDEAFTTLARAVGLGYHDFEHIQEDADLTPLRQDPRFPTFLELLRRDLPGRKPSTH